MTPIDIALSKGVYYLKSVPNPQRLLDRTNPTFKGQRFLVKGKLEDNTDHFLSKESKI